MSVSISLVVSTLNEEHNIADCIRSAQELVNEVIVVDMHSDDRTVEIAGSLGATVHLVERRPFVDPTRNFAIAQATGNWILLLDADERLTPKLATELRIIAEKDQADVVTIQFDTYMFGRHIRYSGWQEERHRRFFKKGFLEYPDREIHANPIIIGRQLILDGNKGKIQHFNFQDLRDFIKTINDYTDGESLQLLRSGVKITPLRGAYWGLLHFCRRYLKMRGYKDGMYGFILSVFMGFYWFLAFSKAWERKQRSQK
ncbi:MAG: glycosyltransferase family 2 protein [Candidatus Omnitrophota bacterium]